ncbi:hypothetical protein EGR_05615 [Echinococcus granulosus]|uniref:Uncharacterized protein n=1 Tax=Echinococcus granulosus TaxID=6210 RepID=W6UEU9_ECHGR|nr:hypothetical protein EGR_05615 [Echinococcus granulosus]EUB59588.1 hypothetical protein EGR_05615 [Echinococcus granulosus]
MSIDTFANLVTHFCLVCSLDYLASRGLNGQTVKGGGCVSSSVVKGAFAQSAELTNLDSSSYLQIDNIRSRKILNNPNLQHINLLVFIYHFTRTTNSSCSRFFGYLIGLFPLTHSNSYQIKMPSTLLHFLAVNAEW